MDKQVITKVVEFYRKFDNDARNIFDLPQKEQDEIVEQLKTHRKTLLDLAHALTGKVATQKKKYWGDTIACWIYMILQAILEGEKVDHHLLSIIGGWGDTMNDEETLQNLKDYVFSYGNAKPIKKPQGNIERSELIEIIDRYNLEETYKESLADAIIAHINGR